MEKEKKSKCNYKLRSIINLLKPRRIKNAIKKIKDNGLLFAVKEAKSKINSNSEMDYELWFENHKATEKELENQRNTKFDYVPKFSVIVPTYKTPEKFLKEMIDSVINQTYSNWELCIADGSEDDNVVSKVLDKYASIDSRIKYELLTENMGISENTNSALDMASGDFIVLLDHDDMLAPDALFEVAKAVNIDKDIDVLYTDEDKISTDLKHHFQPSFKPDFSIDLLRSNNYICHMFVVRKSIVDDIKGFRKEYDGSQDYDFIFRTTFLARKIKHIPQILYHWRMHQNSVAGNPESKMYAYEAGRKAIEDNLKQNNIKATVSHTDYLGFYRVKYDIIGRPKVSIIIYNKDDKEKLEKCINSILEKSTYDNYEIVVIENDSSAEEVFEYYNEIEKDEKITVVRCQKEFNCSKVKNYGIKESNGEYIILLDNDTEIITEDWIQEMLGVCQRKDVGIVGAKLYYPDDTIQHAGVVIGLGEIAGHVMCGLKRCETGYLMKSLINQDVSAVSASCLMVKRSIFDEVDGFEEKLKEAFYDIDFCLKVREKGYLIVYDANVELYHYETKIKENENTLEKTVIFASDIDFMKKKWNNILENGDPFYNPNLSLEPLKGYELKNN